MVNVRSRQSMEALCTPGYEPNGVIVVNLLPKKRVVVVDIVYERLPEYDSVGNKVVFRISLSLKTKLAIEPEIVCIGDDWRFSGQALIQTECAVLALMSH